MTPQEKTILITGGSGFLGRRLAQMLKEKGFKKLIIFDQRPPEDFEQLNVQFIQGDITSEDDVAKALKGVTHVYNLVSLLPCSRAGQQFWKVNVGGTENLLTQAEKAGVEKVVHVSSSVVYGVPAENPLKETSPVKPIGDYGHSKLAAEEVCRTFMDRLSITIIRPRFILGPGRLGVLTILFDWIRDSKRIYVLGSGNNRFQMVSVDDLVRSCIGALDKGDGETFNIGGEKIPTVRELMNGLIAHAGSQSKVTPIPAGLARVSLKTLDRLNLVPLGTEHYLIADKDYMLDISKAKRILDWEPQDDIVQKMIEAYEWYFAHKEALANTIKSEVPEQRFLKILKFFS